MYLNYIDVSRNGSYPKTLKIRNHVGGGIWQVYHVNEKREAVMLSNKATLGGFEAITLEDYDTNAKETWPGWRELDAWKERWASDESRSSEEML